MAPRATSAASHEAAAKMDVARRRIERLRQVREQERQIAAATRARYQQSMSDEHSELLKRAEEERERQRLQRQSQLVENLDFVCGAVGFAHSAAHSTVAAQRTEALHGTAVWQHGWRREAERQSHAMREVEAKKATRQHRCEAVASRRRAVAHTEAERSAARVAMQRQAAEAERQSAQDSAAAAVARASAFQGAPIRSRVRVDFASTRLHDALLPMRADRPPSGFAYAAVQRHVGVTGWKEGCGSAIAGHGPSLCGAPPAGQCSPAGVERVCLDWTGASSSFVGAEVGQNATELAMEEIKRQREEQPAQAARRAWQQTQRAERGRRALMEVRLTETRSQLERELDQMEASRRTRKSREASVWQPPAATQRDRARRFADAQQHRSAQAFEVQFCNSVCRKELRTDSMPSCRTAAASSAAQRATQLDGLYWSSATDDDAHSRCADSCDGVLSVHCAQQVSQAVHLAAKDHWSDDNAAVPAPNGLAAGVQDARTPQNLGAETEWLPAAPTSTSTVQAERPVGQEGADSQQLWNTNARCDSSAAHNRRMAGATVATLALESTPIVPTSAALTTCDERQCGFAPPDPQHGESSCRAEVVRSSSGTAGFNPMLASCGPWSYLHQPLEPSAQGEVQPLAIEPSPTAAPQCTTSEPGPMPGMAAAVLERNAQHADRTAGAADCSHDAAVHGSTASKPLQRHVVPLQLRPWPCLPSEQPDAVLSGADATSADPLYGSSSAKRRGSKAAFHGPGYLAARFSARGASGAHGMTASSATVAALETNRRTARASASALHVARKMQTGITERLGGPPARTAPARRPRSDAKARAEEDEGPVSAEPPQEDVGVAVDEENPVSPKTRGAASQPSTTAKLLHADADFNALQDLHSDLASEDAFADFSDCRLTPSSSLSLLSGTGFSPQPEQSAFAASAQVAGAYGHNASRVARQSVAYPKPHRTEFIEFRDSDSDSLSFCSNEDDVALLQDARALAGLAQIPFAGRMDEGASSSSFHSFGAAPAPHASSSAARELEASLLAAGGWDWSDDSSVDLPAMRASFRRPTVREAPAAAEDASASSRAACSTLNDRASQPDKTSTVGGVGAAAESAGRSVEGEGVCTASSDELEALLAAAASTASHAVTAGDPLPPLSPTTSQLLGLPADCGILEAVERLQGTVQFDSGTGPTPLPAASSSLLLETRPPAPESTLGALLHGAPSTQPSARQPALVGTASSATPGRHVVFGAAEAHLDDSPSPYHSAAQPKPSKRSQAGIETSLEAALQYADRADGSSSPSSTQGAVNVGAAVTVVDGNASLEATAFHCAAADAAEKRLDVCPSPQQLAPLPVPVSLTNESSADPSVVSYVVAGPSVILSPPSPSRDMQCDAAAAGVASMQLEDTPVRHLVFGAEASHLEDSPAHAQSRFGTAREDEILVSAPVQLALQQPASSSLSSAAASADDVLPGERAAPAVLEDSAAVCSRITSAVSPAGASYALVQSQPSSDLISPACEPFSTSSVAGGPHEAAVAQNSTAALTGHFPGPGTSDAPLPRVVLGSSTTTTTGAASASLSASNAALFHSPLVTLTAPASHIGETTQLSEAGPAWSSGCAIPHEQSPSIAVPALSGSSARTGAECSGIEVPGQEGRVDVVAAPAVVPSHHGARGEDHPPRQRHGGEPDEASPAAVSEGVKVVPPPSFLEGFMSDGHTDQTDSEAGGFDEAYLDASLAALTAALERQCPHQCATSASSMPGPSAGTLLAPTSPSCSNGQAALGSDINQDAHGCACGASREGPGTGTTLGQASSCLSNEQAAAGFEVNQAAHRHACGASGAVEPLAVSEVGSCVSGAQICSEAQPVDSLSGAACLADVSGSTVVEAMHAMIRHRAPDVRTGSRSTSSTSSRSSGAVADASAAQSDARREMDIGAESACHRQQTSQSVEGSSRDIKPVATRHAGGAALGAVATRARGTHGSGEDYVAVNRCHGVTIETAPSAVPAHRSLGRATDGASPALEAELTRQRAARPTAHAARALELGVAIAPDEANGSGSDKTEDASSSESSERPDITCATSPSQEALRSQQAKHWVSPRPGAAALGIESVSSSVDARGELAPYEPLPMGVTASSDAVMCIQPPQALLRARQTARSAPFRSRGSEVGVLINPSEPREEAGGAVLEVARGSPAVALVAQPPQALLLSTQSDQLASTSSEVGASVSLEQRSQSSPQPQRSSPRSTSLAGHSPSRARSSDLPLQATRSAGGTRSPAGGRAPSRSGSPPVVSSPLARCTRSEGAQAECEKLFASLRDSDEIAPRPRGASCSLLSSNPFIVADAPARSSAARGLRSSLSSTSSRLPSGKQ